MENLQQFVKPELLVLVPVLYFAGVGIKKSKVKDELIPLILGGAGIVLSSLYVCGTEGLNPVSLFTAITQGILCAGGSVYINNIVKQTKQLANEQNN